MTVVQGAFRAIGWSGIIPLGYLLLGWLSAKERAEADADPDNPGFYGVFWAYRHRAFFLAWARVAAVAWACLGVTHLVA